jgi:hypothetical protein
LQAGRYLYKRAGWALERPATVWLDEELVLVCTFDGGVGLPIGGEYGFILPPDALFRPNDIWPESEFPVPFKKP